MMMRCLMCTQVSLTTLVLVVCVPLASDAIDCFTCTSLNNSNPGCHDPFHPTDALYTHYCMVPKEGHTGRFPAQYCVKLNGFSVFNNVQLTIRVCSLESMDNSCGMFRYQNELMKGCITTCNENGCNSSKTNKSSLTSIVAFISLAIFIIR